MNEIEHSYIETNGVTLHVAIAGQKDGPLVILLHGFPEFWYGWNQQVTPLVKAGYRVVIPDQRGYNLSEKPEEIDAYKLTTLRDDVIGIIDQLGYEQASIIGHDWGGAVAWYLAASHPSYVNRLIVINIPHPEIMKKALYTKPTQLLRSSYMLFFQLPTLPEKFLQSNQFQSLKTALRMTSNRNTFDDHTLHMYLEAWSMPYSLTGMLNWYRAIRRGSLNHVPISKITIPVCIIWGKNDQFLPLELAKRSLEMCQDGQLIAVDEATHWVHHEQPTILNQLIRQFLTN
ncbi:alpha/beta fold hydrolase [Bacillus suaedae]|uniref:Alpha/beta hydrolase n=1 Tax=Halalkalibacter suaedae TaxID=2822140 RepID=A0A941AT61_9BACI|nr:alpha/beta hydrolase [Bacillus suaedae]MBP3950984.1 alpha/beta hydrolase [Bacillus suaedae]